MLGVLLSVLVGQAALTTAAPAAANVAEPAAQTSTTPADPVLCKATLTAAVQRLPKGDPRRRQLPAATSEAEVAVEGLLAQGRMSESELLLQLQSAANEAATGALSDTVDACLSIFGASGDATGGARPSTVGVP